MYDKVSVVYINLMIMMFACPFFACCLSLVYRFFDWLRARKGEPKEFPTSRRRMVIWATVFFLFQPMVVSECFQVFTCMEIGDKMVMFSDMRVECYTLESGHLVWVGLVAFPAMMMYVFVIPGLVLKHMRSFFADGIQEDQDEEASLSLQWGCLS